MIGSALVSSVMGLVYNYWIFIGLIFLSGLSQCLMGPAANIIVGSTFSERSLTAVLGVSAVSKVAGSAATTFQLVTISEHFSWRYGFYIPSLLSAIFGLLSVLLLKPSKLNQEEEKKKITQKQVKFWKVLTIPKIPWISFSSFFLKGIRNAVFFWLPYYLSTVRGYSDSDAAYLSLIYELGSFFGPIVLSAVFNMIMTDIHASIVSTLAVIGFTLLLMVPMESFSLLFISLFCSGAFTVTVDIIFGTSYLTKVVNNREDRSTALSVVNGISSIGNIVEGPLIAYLSVWFGMTSMVPCIVVFCILSLIGMFVLKFKYE